MVADDLRSRVARAAAEAALVRVVHHYGSKPEFVLLGGLVPELLCAGSGFRHAGTTDVDVQVDLEISCGSATVRRFENALRNAEFRPDSSSVWRWTTDGHGGRAVVKFELLADDDSHRNGSILEFDACDSLGAVNLHGTGFASRDIVPRTLSARIGDLTRRVELDVTGLAGFLMAKTMAARVRRKPKDWYDIAFVLLHNDSGGPEEAARAVLARFGDELVGSNRNAVDDLAANFSDARSQGPSAYASQMIVDHPDLDRSEILADAVLAVRIFHRMLLDDRASAGKAVRSP